MMEYCRRRGNVNLDGVASSKRCLMIVALAAARSMLHGRAAFATALGKYTRTLLQHIYNYIVCYCRLWECIEPVVSLFEECEGWKLQVP